MIVTTQSYPQIKWDIEWLNTHAIGSRFSSLRTILHSTLPDGYDTVQFSEDDLYYLITKLYYNEQRKNETMDEYPDNREYRYDKRQAFYFYTRSHERMTKFYKWFKQFLIKNFHKNKVYQVNVFEGINVHDIILPIEKETDERIERHKEYHKRHLDSALFEMQRMEKRENDYKEYLASPLRKEKRKLVIEKDWWRCVMCWTSEWPRECHHRKYDKFKKEDEIEDLFLLCKCCHDRHHKNPDKQSYYRMLRDALAELDETTSS
jgi:5-methylcytosine-specific restriction endonuclease McrA